MANCKGCGAEILWKKSNKDKWVPCNADCVNGDDLPPHHWLMLDDGSMLKEAGPELTGWVPHWQTCPDAAKFKKG